VLDKIEKVHFTKTHEHKNEKTTSELISTNYLKMASRETIP
jgi:hypothetical protein